MKYFRNRLSFIIAVLFIIFTLAGCSSIDSNTAYNKSSSTNDKLLVHYIDVGQADSALVQVNGKNLLIDAGNRGDDDTIIAYLQKQGVKKLDFVIASHPHEDHIGGMSAVIKKFTIGDFYAPKATADTKVFEDMIKALGNKKIKIAKAGVELNLGDNVDVEILAPNKEKYKETNDYSAVVKLTYGNSKFIFMGDAEKLSEGEILQNNFDVDSDVIKLGHHGSSTSSSKEFLDKVSPNIAVISSGKGNDYGHPHKETLTELKSRNLTIYRTDIDGTIVLASDGKKITKQ